MRLSNLPTRTRACRWANAAPRSVTSDDQCPAPKRAVSAPAAAFWRAAMTATSSRVASRNRSLGRDALRTSEPAPDALPVEPIRVAELRLEIALFGQNDRVVQE